MATDEASSSRGFRFPEYILHSSMYPEMTQDDKEEFIKELCHGSEKAIQRLKRTSKKNDIVELITMENRWHRKFSRAPKWRLISILHSIILEKISRSENQAVVSTDPAVSYTLPLPALNAPTAMESIRMSSHPSRLNLVKFCRNSGCRAELKSTDVFCRQCSCHLCYRYDYDKGKNSIFWLVCGSQTRSQDKPCGFFCHLDCALKDERVGNMGNARVTMLDGSFQCGNCGSVNDLLSCWRNLLMDAKDVRLVSDLCSRIYLSHKILNSSQKYHHLHSKVDEIKRMLERELGSLRYMPLQMSCGRVQRLPIAIEAQKLCASALDLLDLEPLQFNRIESQNCEGGVAKQSNLGGVGNGRHLESGINETILQFNHIEFQDFEGRVGNESDLGGVGDESNSEGSIDETILQFNHIVSQNCEGGLASESNLGGVGIENNSQGGIIGRVGIESNSEGGINDSVPELTGDKPQSKNMLMIDLNELPENHSEDYTFTDGVVNESRNEMTTLPISTCGRSELPENHMEYNPNDGEPKESRNESTALPMSTSDRIGLPENLTEEYNSNDGELRDNRNESTTLPMSTSDRIKLPENLAEVKISNGGGGLKEIRNMITALPSSTCDRILPVPTSLPAEECSGDSKGTNGRKIGRKTLDLGALGTVKSDVDTDSKYQQTVNVVRQLEVDGHIDSRFRKEFITWFSMRATAEYTLQISALIDAFPNDLPNLADQLVHTYGEEIRSKKPPPAATVN